MYKCLDVESRNILLLIVQADVKIINYTLLLHVMDDLSRCVVRPKTLAAVFFDQVLEHLASISGSIATSFSQCL